MFKTKKKNVTRKQKRIKRIRIIRQPSNYDFENDIFTIEMGKCYTDEFGKRCKIRWLKIPKTCSKKNNCFVKDFDYIDYIDSKMEFNNKHYKFWYLGEVDYKVVFV